MTVTESPSSSERAVLTRRAVLLSRHAHEEDEHKAVAFDVFQRSATATASAWVS
jgi:predicted metal-dependent hydrolase